MKTKTQIIDGHPRTTNIIQDPKTGECIESEDNELLSDLPEIVQKFVVLWIAMKIHERKTPNYGSTSYGLKHILENEFRKMPIHIITIFQLFFHIIYKAF